MELQLSDDLEPADLERIRRTFAYRNHPDRVGPAHKMHALRRMTVANVLIDQALKTARARAQIIEPSRLQRRQHALRGERDLR